MEKEFYKLKKEYFCGMKFFIIKKDVFLVSIIIKTAGRKHESIVQRFPSLEECRKAAEIILHFEGRYYLTKITNISILKNGRIIEQVFSGNR